jgi:L-fuculose-phosphate aldolase
MDTAIQKVRFQIAEIGALMYERQLTDAGGGNISVRVGDVICLSPRYSGQRHRWQLDVHQILVIDRAGNKLDGEGDLSRETKVHLKLHNTYPDAGTAVIHAHTQYVLVFAAMNRPIPPVLEQTVKFGEIPVVDYAPAHSQDLADHIAGALKGQEARIRKQAAAAIAPWHGLFVMGKDLDMAYDAVERINTNAQILLLGQQYLGTNDYLAAERAALAAAMGKYET